MPALPTPLKATLVMAAAALAAGACADREVAMLRDLRGGADEARGAAYAIGQRGHANTPQVAALLALTTAPGALARYAVWALGEIDDPVPERRDHLLDLLGHTRPDVRGAACWALARRHGKDPAVRQALQTLRGDANRAVAELASDALENL